MDIDVNRQKRPSPIVCYHCQATGHLAKACPQRFDIRLLTADERREYVEAFLADMDKVPETIAVAESEEQEENSESQGFHANSG